MKTNNWILLCLLAVCFASCVSPKQVAYFQSPVPDATGDEIELTARYIPTIQTSDVLSIYVSSLNSEASSFFNPYAPVDRSATAAPATSAGQLTSAVGYLVDNKGHVELPLIGQVKVGGLSTTDARDLIREKLRTYLKEPTVNVRFLNFKVSVMGEVARPSMFTIPNEQITLPEALSLAGDVTIYGRRDNVLVIREVGGKKQFARINLNKRDLFTSPYYYLHPNDIVYVEPGKARVASIDRIYQLVPAMLSALSFLAIIIRRY
ncbi:polysaccharide biosynthesis/export family protein [Tellurirhabdus rosea]|uniref:polysaccharide biosynthesis/export family protein n=1 Tax=Tellurirhabdus rosea TaxID=2674997 RepID=UPI00225C0D0F|nr:polysaccharide biosynthesis/export family protein [Tellurirhabdus rosea]